MIPLLQKEAADSKAAGMELLYRRCTCVVVVVVHLVVIVEIVVVLVVLFVV